jgi:hypothetical protein
LTGFFFHKRSSRSWMHRFGRIEPEGPLNLSIDRKCDCGQWLNDSEQFLIFLTVWTLFLLCSRVCQDWRTVCSWLSWTWTSSAKPGITGALSWVWFFLDEFVSIIVKSWQSNVTLFFRWQLAQMTRRLNLYADSYQKACQPDFKPHIIQ